MQRAGAIVRAGFPFRSRRIIVALETGKRGWIAPRPLHEAVALLMPLRTAPLETSDTA